MVVLRNMYFYNKWAFDIDYFSRSEAIKVSQFMDSNI